MLSLVIPCYNEEKSLPRLIEKCQALVDDDIEIILVDNGSNDGTPKILQPSASVFMSISCAVRNKAVCGKAVCYKETKQQACQNPKPCNHLILQ